MSIASAIIDGKETRIVQERKRKDRKEICKKGVRNDPQLRISKKVQFKQGGKRWKGKEVGKRAGPRDKHPANGKNRKVIRTKGEKKVRDGKATGPQRLSAHEVRFGQKKGPAKHEFRKGRKKGVHQKERKQKIFSYCIVQKKTR